ncbi:fibroblast growth factor 23 isoform X2 [Oryzias latipes]|uniref:Fibroblast growth factor 23 n=1 Tax=Oryzias latipes TaxID=8090 RepID=H2MM76_ORYLA|nr:fibroblast growth factor 23 isoform X2 [Oryzias latipes]
MGQVMRDTTMLALVLAVLQGFSVRQVTPDPSPLVSSNWGNPRRFIHLQTSTDVCNFYLEIRSDGTVRKAASRTSYSVILLKSETRDRVAILGVKSNRYLCMDLEGNPFSSPICLREECLFNHKLLENNRDVYYSTRTSILFNLEGSKQVYIAGQNVPQTSLFLPKKNTVPLERLIPHREKRKRIVDPSDPHGVYHRPAEEGSDSRAVAEQDDADVEVETEMEMEVGDDGRNLSRERPLVPFNDDPWNVNSFRQSSPRGTGTMG